MADRVFKGEIIVTGPVYAENRDAFPEASDDLNEPHAGGLVPFDLLRRILKHGHMADHPGLVRDMVGITITHQDAWVTIDNEGRIEIGLSGA